MEREIAEMLDFLIKNIGKISIEKIFEKKKDLSSLSTDE